MLHAGEFYHHNFIKVTSRARFDSRNMIAGGIVTKVHKILGLVFSP